jgi:hypothetical protein
MSLLGQALSFAAGLLATLALAGLLRRKRARACAVFVAYLASVAVGHLALAVAPRTFWTWEFLTATDLVQALLQIGIVAEITAKTFRPLPAGYLRVRQVLALVGGAVTLALGLSLGPIGGASDLSRALERVFYGLGFLFLAFMVVVRWYGVPIDPLHRTIATGFAFVTMLVGCMSALAQLDPVLGLGRDFIVKTAYPCVLAWWTLSAWRHDDFGRLSLASVRRLHPWRLP